MNIASFGAGCFIFGYGIYLVATFVNPWTIPMGLLVALVGVAWMWVAVD